MKARLLLLLVLAGGLAVYLATAKKPSTTAEDAGAATDDAAADKPPNLALLQKTLSERDLPGREPPDRPDLSVQVEVNRSSGKNRLYFTISERLGF